MIEVCRRISRTGIPLEPLDARTLPSVPLGSPELAISRIEIYDIGVHVITRRRLREFAARHREAAGQLESWYAIVSKTDFASFADIRRSFVTADKVGKFTVFDIGGNKYRLIAAIHYDRGKVYIRHVLTHAEYDRGKWKD